MIKLLTIALLLTSHKFPDSNTSSVQNFVVYYKSSKVGTLKTIQTKKDTEVSYHLHSEVKIMMVAEVNIVEDMKDIFKDGKLENSVYRRSINKDEKANNTVVREPAGYVISKDGKKQNVMKGPIDLTVMSLYYQEPADQAMIYSQSFQQVLKIKKLQPHLYELKIPNGSSTTYQYKDGKLQTVVSDTKWGKVKFVLVG